MTQFDAELTRFSYPQANLVAARGRLDDLLAAATAQEAAKAAAVRATRQRDDAVAARDLWLRQLRTIVKIVIRGRPDLVQRLGL